MSDAAMNDQSLAGSPDGHVHTPLHDLRRAREAQGLHIAILSTALKVPIKKLEALEAGRYEELPGLTFARALASSACRHLKIDPEPILAQIPLASSPSLGSSASAIDTPFIRADESRVPSAGWLSRPALLVGGVLLAGALLVLFWPESLPMGSLTQAEAPAPTATPAPVAEPAPNVVTEPVTAQLPVAPAVAPDAAATGSVSPPPASPPAVPSAPPPAAEAVNTAAAASSLMSIRATSESWVEVSHAGGTVLLRRLLKPGEVVDFTAPLPYAVLLGRVEAAEVTVRGQRFDPTPFARNSVARFEVK